MAAAKATSAPARRIRRRCPTTRPLTTSGPHTCRRYTPISLSDVGRHSAWNKAQFTAKRPGRTPIYAERLKTGSADVRAKGRGDQRRLDLRAAAPHAVLRLDHPPCGA